jgi:hypothetical protein
MIGYNRSAQDYINPMSDCTWTGNQLSHVSVFCFVILYLSSTSTTLLRIAAHRSDTGKAQDRRSALESETPISNDGVSAFPSGAPTS